MAVPLTRRQRQVLRELKRGRTEREIALRLQIAYGNPAMLLHDRYVSVPQAAAMAGCSPSTMGRILEEGKVKFTKPRTHRKVHVPSLMRYLEQQSGERPLRPLTLPYDPFAD